LIMKEKFMDFAKRLVDPSRTYVPEEELRTAIGRGYYSLFHETFEALATRYSLQLINQLRKQRKRSGLNPQRLNRLDRAYLREFNLHKAFPDTLIAIDPRKYMGIVQQMKDFRTQRNKADYDLSEKFGLKDTRMAVEDMDKLVQRIRQV